VPTLHITNGDFAADKLRRIVDGAVTITADVLHEGPAPLIDGRAWYQTRARFLASFADVTAPKVEDQLAAWDREIVEAVARRDDIVLWFEHDLFDQLQLIRTLDLLGRAEGAALHSKVSLICVDRFPGVERFVGLGQLSDDQLATLIGTQHPVTTEQYALATAAWNAFRAADPRDLLDITVRLAAPTLPDGKPDTTHSQELPFLRDALLRFLAEYPSTNNGLSRTEQLALDTLARGPATGGDLFVETQRHEPRPFLGDLPFFDILRALASARVPLVTIDGGGQQLDPRRLAIAITGAGGDVASGRRDHVALNGIDRWRGGVHLVGTDRSPWRWDASRETLVS
jgi:hypothetical protein